MHTVALSSVQAGGAGAGVLVVVALVIRFTLLARMFLYRERPGGSRRQGGAPQTSDRPAMRRQRDQAHAYWEPEQEEGTLPAAGFIGDTAEPGPGAGRDPGQGAARGGPGFQAPGR